MRYVFACCALRLRRLMLNPQLRQTDSDGDADGLLRLAAEDLPIFYEVRILPHLLFWLLWLICRALGLCQCVCHGPRRCVRPAARFGPEEDERETQRRFLAAATPAIAYPAMDTPLAPGTSRRRNAPPVGTRKRDALGQRKRRIVSSSDEASGGDESSDAPLDMLLEDDDDTPIATSRRARHAARRHSDDSLPSTPAFAAPAQQQVPHKRPATERRKARPSAVAAAAAATPMGLSEDELAVRPAGKGVPSKAPAGARKRKAAVAAAAAVSAGDVEDFEDEVLESGAAAAAGSKARAPRGAGTKKRGTKVKSDAAGLPLPLPSAPGAEAAAVSADGWTVAEDAALQHAVRDYAGNWDLVAEIVSGTPQVGARARSARQCQERWRALDAVAREDRKLGQKKAARRDLASDDADTRLYGVLSTVRTAMLRLSSKRGVTLPVAEAPHASHEKAVAAAVAAASATYPGVAIPCMPADIPPREKPVDRNPLRNPLRPHMREARLVVRQLQMIAQQQQLQQQQQQAAQRQILARRAQMASLNAAATAAAAAAASGPAQTKGAVA